MSALLDQDHEQVGQALHWALSPRKMAFGDEGYHALRKRYGWEPAFQEKVDGAFAGMGMVIMEFGEHGIFWKEGKPGSSPTKPMVWNYQSERKEIRVVESLIAFCVAATYFPRAEYLEESDEFAVRPFTLDELHQSLLQMGARAEEEAKAKGQPDPKADDVAAKLQAAYWYLKELPETSDSEGRRGPRRNTLRDLIEKHLKTLKESNRFFVLESQGWRPTPAYKNAVKLALDDPSVVALLNFAWETKVISE